MTSTNEIFGFKKFQGAMNEDELKNISEWTKEYKEFTISFGIPQRHENGSYYGSVRVWKNEGDLRKGAFTMDSLCATDADAMRMATKWAQENINAIA